MGPNKTASSLASGARSVSTKIIISYVIDWVLILGIACIGGAFYKIHGFRHVFNLEDQAISYPMHSDTVTTATLLLVSVIAPAIITAVVSIIFISGPTAARSTPKALIWRRKLWEWNTAWMGLGLALAGAFMVTEGLKDAAGKPRPDLLARCIPDVSRIAEFRVSGLSAKLPSAPTMVDSRICTQTDSSVLRDGFASWPSGHSSFSWAGLFYLSLWLCAKFAVTVPFLTQSNYASYRSSYPSTFEEREAYSASSADTASETAIPPRNQAAAPPIYLLILAFLPVGTALFICLSRYADYRHAGFDIISGAVIGAFFAYFGFRWYHLPIRQGAGWSWGARSRDRAFMIPVGTPSYVGNEGWASAKSAMSTRPHDIEDGGAHAMLGGGMADHPEDETANKRANTPTNY